jgi:hypothetical protein
MAAYQDRPGFGLLRLGVFKAHGVTVEEISDSFHKRQPNAYKYGKLYFAKRIKIMGKWADSERVEMEPPEDLEQQRQLARLADRAEKMQ